MNWRLQSTSFFAQKRNKSTRFKSFKISFSVSNGTWWKRESTVIGVLLFHRCRPRPAKLEVISWTFAVPREPPLSLWNFGVAYLFPRYGLLPWTLRQSYFKVDTISLTRCRSFYQSTSTYNHHDRMHNNFVCSPDHWQIKWDGIRTAQSHCHGDDRFDTTSFFRINNNSWTTWTTDGETEAGKATPSNETQLLLHWRAVWLSL